MTPQVMRILNKWYKYTNQFLETIEVESWHYNTGR